MQKAGVTVLILSLVANIVLLVLFLRPDSKIEPINKSKIDSLEREIDSIQVRKDSIIVQIDTVYMAITANTKHYEETRNNILGYSIDDDYKYFTGYLEWNRNRLNQSIDNERTTEGN